MIDSSCDCHWMARAMELARLAAEAGEVPVGAVLVDGDGREVCAFGNLVEGRKDGTAHAELLVLQEASRLLGEWRLTDCTLYVTKEPCAMCAGAIVNCRVGAVVFGACDPRMGAAGSALDITGFAGMLHRPQVRSRVLEAECSQLLKDFFRRRRAEQEAASEEKY